MAGRKGNILWRKPRKSRAEKEKEDQSKLKSELGLCLIIRIDQHVREKLGSGILVEDLVVHEGNPPHRYLVTSDKVITDFGEFMKNYVLEFRKSAESSKKLPAIPLNEIAASLKPFKPPGNTSGIIFICLKSEIVQNLKGRFLRAEVDDLQNYENFYCLFVDVLPQDFVKWLRIKKNGSGKYVVEEDGSSYTTYESLKNNPGYRPLGGAIFKEVKGKHKCVGMLDFTDDEAKTLSPVFFSSIFPRKGVTDNRALAIANFRDSDQQDRNTPQQGQGKLGKGEGEPPAREPEWGEAGQLQHQGNLAKNSSHEGIQQEGEKEEEEKKKINKQGNKNKTGGEKEQQPEKGEGRGKEEGAVGGAQSCSEQGNSSLNLLGIGSYDITIEPARIPLEGGVPCCFLFIPDLPLDISSGTAKFVCNPGGVVTLDGVKNHANRLVGRRIPPAEREGWVTVRVMGKNDKTGKCNGLGETKIYYFDERRKALEEIVKNVEQFREFFETWKPPPERYSTASRVTTMKSPSSGPMDSDNPLHSLQGLMLLVYTAAETDARQFIELIFNSSAGRVVFNAYRCNSLLPEDVARAFGHEGTAQYLESISKRLSEDLSVNEEDLQASHILELADAVSNQSTMERPSTKPNHDSEHESTRGPFRAYATQRWSFMNRVGRVTLHCKKCDTVLATKQTLILAKVPPSETHLAVREGKEEQVEGKLQKVKNRGEKNPHFCPFNFYCRECYERVANVARVAGKQLICFGIKSVYICHCGKQIKANKLSKVTKELEEECGIEVVNVTTFPPETGRAYQSRGDSQAMVYCDTCGWTHTSHEIDSLTRQVPRDYQRELFLSAMRGNTLVYLPTGSGKTLIAVMVMSCMKKLNPRKVMVFLVDRVPLAHQQRDYIKSQLTDLTVEMLVGDMESPQDISIRQKLANNKVDVLVLTHQIFLNFLAAKNNAPIRLFDVSVLVFDEAHHCSGNHPYNKIMEHYKKTPEQFKPVVLGLTASLAGELTVESTSEKLEKLLENLDSALAIPVESDLLNHVDIQGVIYEGSDCMNTDQVLLQQHIEEHIEYLIEVHFLDVPDPQKFASLVNSPNITGARRKLIESYHGNKKSFKALTVAEHAMHLLGVVEVCEVLGYQYAVESLKECVYRIVYAKSPKDGALNRLIGGQRTFQALKNLADQACRADQARVVVMSDKYNILVKHIKQFLRQAREDPTSRGIIFVSLRKTTFKLCEQIREIPNVTKMLNPYPFVGHGQGSYDGMTWKDEQEKLLKKFREGESKLLICTSVLEEGLDIPKCNLIVCFEDATTLQALTQTHGRVFRRSNSKFVVICNEKEDKDAKDLFLKEENRGKAIKYLMSNPKRQSQAQKFGCEVKKPIELVIPGAVESGVDTSPVMRCSTRISVMVHNMVGETSRVIDFLNHNFRVVSSKPIQSTSSLGEALIKKPVSDDMAFELEPSYNEEAKEFRSKEEFACHVIEVWCMRLTNSDEEPLPVWLQVPPLETHGKSNKPFHWFKASSLCLGTFISRCHFHCEWPLKPTLKDIKMHFDHSFKMLTLHVSRQSPVVPDQDAVVRVSYKIDLRYDEIEDFIIVDTDSSAEAIDVFLTARHPPRLYKQEVPVMEDFFDLVQIDEQDDEDASVTSTSDDESETEGFSTDEEYADEITADFRDASVDLLRNLTDYRSWERASDFHNGENAVSQCFTYCVTMPFHEVVQLRRFLTTVEKRFHKSAFYCRVKESYGKLPDVDIPDSLPFEVKYAAGSVLSFHPLIRGRVLPGKFGRLLLRKSPNIAIAALEKLSKVLEKDKFCDPGSTLESLLKQNNLSTSEMFNRLVPGHCALVKRAVITPTRLLFYPPEVMVTNRVLRKYVTNDFLCVSIRDEDLSKMSAARGNIDDILDGVNRKLDEGLVIAGQRFQFIGSSNNQLRNHSCWFVGPSSLPDDIRRWMGDFTNIKCVASYMARMGQCFSNSLDAVGFATSDDTYFDKENDVETADRKYCFSAGVGKISEKLAAEVVRKIGKPFKPSAFQVCFAGYKGVLALDPRLPGKRAIFRESMFTFDSFHRTLEVLQTSRPQVVFLNHQVIMLLSNLGVPDEVFIKLQNDMLDKMAGMLVNERNAIQLLRSGAKMGVSYHNVSNAGIPLTTEPFFKSLLVAMYRNHLYELLSQARILLPSAEARLMMGVMDELGVLKPGQVFVQYSAVETREDRDDEFNMNKKIVLRGPVVVTRNPCLHPGDVRQLEAIDVPFLGHLVDCVVFPSRGSRPHPNEMAGGDLDGDLYFVCWSKDLLPRKPNYSPMYYPSLPKLEQTEPITTRDMTKFVVDYIRSDQLGVIENAHKALADTEKDGVQSEICLFLAELHSLAVDAPKPGKWSDTMGIGNIKKLPDFMMNSEKPSYPSEKVLGKLYRRCRKFKDTTSEKYDQKVRLDESFLLPGNDSFVENAKEIYSWYRDKMESLMWVYGIETEAEIITGCFMKLRNRLRKEKTDIAELVSEELFTIRSYLRREFFREFVSDGQWLKDDVRISDEMRLKASAWYRVAYTHAHDHAYDSDPSPQKRLLGFPWFINDVMLAVKTQKDRPSQPQALDVCATVGQSLVRLFHEEKAWLLEEFRARIRTKNVIYRHLQAADSTFLLTIIGSTATLLFHKTSNLDLCFLTRGTQARNLLALAVVPPEGNNTSIEEQAKVLKSLIPLLKEETSEQQEQEDENVKNLFWKVRLVNKEHFPVLSCKRPTVNLVDGSNCSPTLSCDFSSSPGSLTVATLLSSYVKSDPHLLLVLRAIHRWCCVTGLSRNAAGTGNTSNLLAALFLAQCMHNRQIENINEEHVLETMAHQMQDCAKHGKQYMELENVIESLEALQNESQFPQVEPDITQIGQMLVNFFQAHDSCFERELPQSLARLFGAPKLSELLKKDHVVLLKEQMQRAYQLLASFGDAGIMLTISGSEDYSVIFLSPLLSSYMAGVGKIRAREIAQKTGATSVIIRPNFSRSRSSVLEVEGSEPAIRAVERKLEEMSTLVSRDRVLLMSGCFVEDASLLVFEGSRSQNDYVSLTPYDGRCHQTHDLAALRIASLVNGTNDVSYTYRCFTEKFFQQLRLLERDFDRQVHGSREFAVHFGRVYMLNVPLTSLEDSESVTIAMLRTNKLKPSILKGDRSPPETVTYVNQEEELTLQKTRRAKRSVTLSETKKRWKGGNPSRSSLFTCVHSPDRVETFLHRSGFQQDGNPTENYSVDISIWILNEELEFCVRFDEKFNFVEVKLPNLRWFMVDVKRPYQHQHNGGVAQDGVHADDNFILDGRETDVRFLLESCYGLSQNDIRDTKYAKYQRILKPISFQKPFTVQEELWKDVRLIRHYKSKKFTCASRGQGEFFNGLTAYLNEVTEYSRPLGPEKVGEFREIHTRWEVSLEAKLPEDLTEKETVKAFLEEVWNYALDLSSFVSK